MLAVSSPTPWIDVSSLPKKSNMTAVVIDVSNSTSELSMRAWN